MAWRQWQDLTTVDFQACDRKTTIAVLPISATEQHGPHLPVGTDAIIAEGMLDRAGQIAPAALDVLVLPVLSICASTEHRNFAGTLSVSSADLAEQIVALAERVKAAGLRKLVIISSHGGNVAAMADAALRCRADLSMLAVNLTWARLGLPDGLVDDEERAFGVHGGFAETSLMLHFRPELVRANKIGKITSLQQRLSEDYDLLRAYGPVGFGWLAEDLDPSGVVGDAASATAAAGQAIAHHQAERFVALAEEIADADIDALLNTSRSGPLTPC